MFDFSIFSKEKVHKLVFYYWITDKNTQPRKIKLNIATPTG